MATSEPYPTQANLANRLAALEERINKLERGAPKTLTTFYSSQGEVLMRSGTDPETDDRVFAVGRDNGQTALEVKTPAGAQTQSIKLYDRMGNVIVGDSETYPDGLRRPSISHNVVKIGSVAPSQTTLIYTTVGEAYFRKTNPAIEVVLNYWSSDGATGIQLRFREIDTFTQLGTLTSSYEPIFNPAPVGGSAVRLVTPPLVLPSSRFLVGDQVHLIVEAQKISGTGNFTVDVLAVRGSDDI